MKREPGLSSEETSALLDSPSGARRRGKGRRILMVLAGIFLLLVVVVALLPKIASPFLTGRTLFTTDQVNATLKSASLRWFGNQEARLALTDSKGQPAGGLDVSVDRGLLALASNWYDLGTIRISGEAELRQGPEKPKPPKPDNQVTVSVQTDRIPLPKDLRARIEVNLSKLAVLDTAGKTTAELRDVQSTADVQIGTPLTLDFSAKSGASPISAKVKIDNWTQPDGSIRLDSASLAKNSPKVDATLKLEDLSVALVDALASTATGRDHHLRAIFGETVTVESQAQGDFAGGSAALSVRSAGAQASARLALKDGVVTLAEPSTIKIASSATKAILENYTSPTQAGGFIVTSAPEATLQLEELLIKLPSPGLDLRGGRIRANATLVNTTGTIALGEGQAASQVSIPAFHAAIVSEDFAGVVRVTAEAASTITTEGRAASAGNLSADVSASGILDTNGAPLSGLPKAIDGRVSLHEAATEILQPLVSGVLASSGVEVDLPRDIGPSANLDLVAKTNGGVIDLDLNATSASATASGALRITDAALTSRDSGISVRLSNAGAIGARALKSPSLQLARPSGQLVLTVPSIQLPLDPATRKPKLELLNAQATAELTDWALTAQVPPGPEQVAGRPVAIELRALTANMAIAPGKGARVQAQSDASADGAPVKVAADLTLPNALAGLSGAKPPASASIAEKLGPALAIGHVEVSGIPATIADALPRSTTSTSTMGPLVREAVGESITLSLDSSQDASGALAVKAAANGSHANLGLDAKADSSAIVASASGAGTIGAGLIDAFLSGNPADKPRLTSPASYTLTVEPVSIPFDANGSPVIAKAGVLKARAAIAGKAVVQSGAQSYGVQDFAVNASVPLSALAEGGGGTASVHAGGGMLSSDGGAMGSLTANASIPLGAALTLAGPADIEVRATEVSTAGIDRALGQPLLVSGALGPAAAITATTRITPPGGSPIGIAEALAKADLVADLTLNSQRLEIKRPLHARIQGDRVSLESPDPIAWTIDPAWFDRFVLGKGQDKSSTDLALAAPARAELVLTRAIVARTNADKGIAGPVFPGIFDLDATARIPSMELVDSRSVRTQMGDAVLKLRSNTASAGQPVSLGFDLSFARLAVVPDPGKAGPGGGDVKGTIAQIATPNGTVDTSNPVITAKGQIRSLPSALVDAFSVKNGLPGELLGPSVNVALDAQNFSKAGGTIDFSAVSTETGSVLENGATKQLPRAELSLKGVSQNGVLVAPINVTLRRIESGLDKRLSGVLPMLAEVEKRFEDRPTVISSPQLALPLDGNISKLNGTVNIDPGDARFKTSNRLGPLLRAIKAKDEGKIMQRLKPLTVTATNGVLSYPRWSLPMGEFNMEVEGSVDLPRSFVDMVVWVPFGQLVDDTSRIFSQIPGVNTAGNVINQATMVPIRVSGPMGNTTAAPDATLFGKTFLKNLTPDKAIDVIKDIFKRPK